jgi:hypothetical protein
MEGMVGNFGNSFFKFRSGLIGYKITMAQMIFFRLQTMLITNGQNSDDLKYVLTSAIALMVVEL